MHKYLSGGEVVALRERFGVHDGQIRSPYTFKNMWLRFGDVEGGSWDDYADVDSFSYGDVNQDDLLRFMSELQAGEMIIGLWESWDFNGVNRDYGKIPRLNKDSWAPSDVAFTVTKDAIWSPTRTHINIEV